MMSLNKLVKSIQAVFFSLVISSIIIVLGVWTYSYSLYKFLALFDLLRQGRYLVLALYVPPLILICSLLFSSLFAVASLTGGKLSLYCLSSFVAYSTVPVLLVAGLGIIIGLFITNPTPVSIYVFISDAAYLSIFYSLSAIAWFLWILPSTLLAFWLECPKGNADGKLIYSYAKRFWGTIIARWLFSLLIAGLIALTLQVTLVELKIGVHHVITAKTSDWMLNRLLDTYVPRTASLLAAPIWIIILVYTYVRLMVDHIKRLSKQ